MPVPHPSLLCLVLFLLRAGCVAPARKTEMRDLAKLPHSEGNYMGKLLPGPPWLYFGSNETFHYFRYTYTRGSRVFEKRLKIPRVDLRLEFETRFVGYDAQGMEVVPLHGVGSGIYGFVRATSPRPEDFDWTRRFPALPRFDETL